MEGLFLKTFNDILKLHKKYLVYMYIALWNLKSHKYMFLQWDLKVFVELHKCEEMAYEISYLPHHGDLGSLPSFNRIELGVELARYGYVEPY